MPRPPKTPSGRDLVESKISEITALAKDISPQASVVSFERYEDDDATSSSIHRFQ